MHSPIHIKLEYESVTIGGQPSPLDFRLWRQKTVEEFNCLIIHHHHHHHHLLTRSCRTRLEISLMVSPGYFCLLVCSFLIFIVTCYLAFCLYVRYSCILSILGLCLVILQSRCLFYNLSKCFVLFFSYISSLPLAVILRASHALMAQCCINVLVISLFALLKLNFCSLCLPSFFSLCY